MDYRERVAAAHDAGMQTDEIVDNFGCSPAWKRRLIQRRRELGTLEPLKRTLPDRRKLKDPDLERLRRFLERKPDATLGELVDELKLSVSQATVSRTLKKMGLSRKKRRPMPPSRIGRMSPRPAGRGSTASRASG
jgi:transposase